MCYNYHRSSNYWQYPFFLEILSHTIQQRPESVCIQVKQHVEVATRAFEKVLHLIVDIIGVAEDHQ